MGRTVIVGDGAAGLSAALLLAKNGHDTWVYGTDQTLLHHAHLYNYLGVPDSSGSAFHAVARQQVLDVGATFVDAEVTAIERREGGGFAVHADDRVVDADHVVLAGGRAASRLAAELGLTTEDGAIEVDAHAATSQTGVYAAGHLVYPTRSQAIISAGDGAKAALDILTREAGSDVQDWDSPGD